MIRIIKKSHFALSGGGIKGIAYVGAFEVIEKMGYSLGNIAGVSAGALVGAFLGAGYKSNELKSIMEEFDFKNIQLDRIEKMIPLISKYMEVYKSPRYYRKEEIRSFITKQTGEGQMRVGNDETEFLGYRGGLLKKIILFSQEGCFLDGDYLEEWVSNTLAKRGIKTFGDLRGGIADRVNPRGYKVRMTAVDANRGRVIVLPDDVIFYGIEPDRLEVAKAVRMSTSVPFAFRPVELKKTDGKTTKTYHIVDGGVFDNFPIWLIDSLNNVPVLGFRLDGGGKSKLFSIDTPLNILKALLSAVHDLGIPKTTYNPAYVANIDDSKISFLDFNLSQEDQEYLNNCGKNAAETLFNNIQMRFINKYRDRRVLYYLFRRKYF